MERNVVRMGISLDKNVVEKLEFYCQKYGMKKSQAISYLITKTVEELGTGKEKTV